MLTGALLALSACAIEAQSNYSVTFPVGAKADNTMAYLVDWDSAQKIDSVIVSNGTVRFEGKVRSHYGRRQAWSCFLYRERRCHYQ